MRCILLKVKTKHKGASDDAAASNRTSHTQIFFPHRPASGVAVLLSWRHATLTCLTQTPPLRRKTRARCGERDVWPTPLPFRATATRQWSTGLTGSSRVRPPHLLLRPPRPIREEGLSPPAPTLTAPPSTPTPKLLRWLILCRTPILVSASFVIGHFWTEALVCFEFLNGLCLRWSL